MRLAADLAEQIIGRTDLIFDTGNIQSIQTRMIIGMVSQLTPDILHAPDDIPSAFQIASEHKKRRPGIIFFKNLQKFSGTPSGPVIKGQCNHRTVRIHITPVLFPSRMPSSPKI